MQIGSSILSEKANKINIFWPTVSKDAVAEKANRLYEWTGNERTMVASGNIQTGRSRSTPSKTTLCPA